MANNCDFDMKVVGTKEALDKFDNMIEDAIWRVYEITKYDSYTDTEECGNYYGGDCAWSISTAMLNTLQEMTKECGVIAECYGEEYGCCFNEHYIIDNGNITTNECVNAYCTWIDDDLEELVRFGAMLKECEGDDFDDLKLETIGEDIYYNRLEHNWEV